MPGEVVDSSSLHTTETKSLEQLQQLLLPLCNALTSNASMIQMISVQLTLGAASMRHSTRTQGSPPTPIMGTAFDGGAHPGRRLLMPQHAGTDFPGGKAEAAPTHF